jgi:hypothetical protein
MVDSSNMVRKGDHNIRLRKHVHNICNPIQMPGTNVQTTSLLYPRKSTPTIDHKIHESLDDLLNILRLRMF